MLSRLACYSFQFQKNYSFNKTFFIFLSLSLAQFFTFNLRIFAGAKQCKKFPFRACTNIQWTEKKKKKSALKIPWTCLARNKREKINNSINSEWIEINKQRHRKAPIWRLERKHEIIFLNQAAFPKRSPAERWLKKATFFSISLSFV